jgi:UDP-N-acetyl-D-mannosaminuronic acid dehydrogenase
MSDKGNVCVVGTGHVGLPLAAVLAEVGFAVTGYDTNEDFVTRVNTTGVVGFREEGLDELLAKHLHKGLTLTSSPPAGQDVYIITVGTPLEPGTKRPYLDRIRVAVQRLVGGFGPNPLLILRSTVSIGTTRNVVLPEIRRHTQRFGLAFCPERTIEGRAIPEMRTLPQIVGGLDAESADRAEALFRVITPTIVRVSSLETAEMIKLINNSYRDLTFAFANEIALIAERMGLSAAEMIHAANVDYPRSHVAQPGFVGGPCLEKDALILIDSLQKIDFTPRVIEEARKINQALPGHVAARIIEELGSLRPAPARARVLITGFAFKGRPATEDVRGSAAIPLMRRLQAAGIEIWGHDFETPAQVIADLGAHPCTLEEGFEQVDGVIIVNNHPGYKSAHIPALARRLRAPAFLFDSWSLFDIRDFRDVAGLRYAPLGAPFCEVPPPGETQ